MSKTPRQRIYDKNDELWGLIIRSKLRCELCDKVGDIKAFDPHHIKSRGHSTTRWWLGNGVCLCKGCHRFKIHMDTFTASILIDKLKVKRGQEWHNELVDKCKYVEHHTMSDLREIKENLTEVVKTLKINSVDT